MPGKANGTASGGQSDYGQSPRHQARLPVSPGTLICHTDDSASLIIAHHIPT